MEATGVYWKPVWQVLDDGDVFDEILLVNPAHIKNVPGRKTDVNETRDSLDRPSCWSAGCCAGVRATGRDPPRYGRSHPLSDDSSTEERSREVQRLQKLLEDANVKLTSVA